MRSGILLTTQRVTRAVLALSILASTLAAVRPAWGQRPTVAGGASMEKPSHPVAHYFLCRAKDLGDIFRVQGGRSMGLHLDVEATDLAHLGIGMAKGELHGWMGRRSMTVQETHVGFPISNVATAARSTGTTVRRLPWSEELRQFGDMIRGLFVFHIHREKVGAYEFADECYGVLPMFINQSPQMRRKEWLKRFNVNVGATVVFVGGRLGVSLGEVADLLTGIVGFDLAGDDPLRLPARLLTREP